LALPAWENRVRVNKFESVYTVNTAVYFYVLSTPAATNFRKKCGKKQCIESDDGVDDVNETPVGRKYIRKQKRIGRE